MFDFLDGLNTLFAALLLSAIVYPLFLIFRFLFRRIGITKKANLEKYAELHTLPFKRVKSDVQFFYELPSKMFVEFTILDETNSLVKTIVNKEQEKGAYPVDFDTRELKNGKYFYLLKTPTSSTTKIMIIEN